jgi:hypothetical protein
VDVVAINLTMAWPCSGQGFLSDRDLFAIYDHDTSNDQGRGVRKHPGWSHHICPTKFHRRMATKCKTRCHGEARFRGAILLIERSAFSVPDDVVSSQVEV